MKKVALAVALAAGLSGCAIPQSGDRTWHADINFSPAVRQCINDAADVWNYQTAGISALDVVYDYNPHETGTIVTVPAKVIEQRFSTEESYADRFLLGQSGKTLLGSYKMALVTDRFAGDMHLCRLTAMHEFGHMLMSVSDNDHSSIKTYIMYPAVYPQRTECLKTNDLARFCMFNACTSDKVLRPCDDQEDSSWP